MTPYYQPAACVLFVMTCASISSTLHADTKGDETIVASVNGVSILYRDIKVDPEIVRITHKGSMSADHLSSKVRQREVIRLAGKIREIIFKRKIAELGLAVSEKEVDSRIEEILRQAKMTDEKAAAICKTIQSAYRALVAWHKNPSKGDAIYKEKLAGSLISKEQWKLYQICYNTPEKLRRMKVPKHADDMKRNSRESSRRDVYHKKLENIITGRVSVTIEEIRLQYYKQYGHMLPKPAFDDVRGTIQSKLLAKKKQQAKADWWREQYEKSNIKVHCCPIIS